MRVFRLSQEQEKEFEGMEKRLGIRREDLVCTMVESFTEHLKDLKGCSDDSARYELFLSDSHPDN